jgi:hypothetical protein
MTSKRKGTQSTSLPALHPALAIKAKAILADKLPHRALPLAFKAAIDKMSPARLVRAQKPAKRLSGVAWLLRGDPSTGQLPAIKRWPKEPEQSVAAWARELAKKAEEEGYSLEASTIATRIGEEISESDKT